MKRYLPFVIIAAVAALAIAAGAMLFRVKKRAVSSRVTNSTASGKAALTPVHVRGAPNAPVTLEEFGDFQCPACAIVSEVIRSLEQDYGPRLRVVFWHFPLAAHWYARDAALAAEAASLQGRFWEMHDLLYKNQPDWSRAAQARALFDGYAAGLHLDVARFRKDSQSDQTAARVRSEQEYGLTRGVQNTPTLFVNNREVPPPFTAEGLRNAIDAAMAGKNP